MKGFYEISGELDAGTTVTFVFPKSYISDEGAFLAEHIDENNAAICINSLTGIDLSGIKFRNFRNGYQDEKFQAEVITPYPWSSKTLICNRPVVYVSRTGWFNGAFTWLWLAIKESKCYAKIQNI